MARNELQDAYDALAAVWDEDDELPPFEELSRARAAMAKSRIPAMLDFVASHEEAEVPLVVFSDHRAPVLALEGRPGWAVITGSTPTVDRDRAVEDFQAGKLSGIALTIAAGGVGLTLTHASNELFVDRAWNPSANLQAEDRCIRIGQTAQSVTITVMKSRDALGRRIEEIIEQKTALIEAAIEKSVGAVSVKETKKSGAPITAEELAARAKAIEEAEAEVEKAAAKTYIEKRSEGVKARAGKGSAGNTSEMGVSWPLETVHAAIGYLRAGCDGAREKDGSGFSAADVRMGWALAATAPWSPEEESVARALCVIYRRQLSHFSEEV